MSELKQVEELLPEVVREMVEVIGFPDTEKVIANFGGVDFYFSLGKHYFPRLVKVIGIEQAGKLRAYFDRERLYIPRCEVALKRLRNLRFKAEYDLLKNEGKSGNFAMLELCPKYGFTERFAFKMLASLNQQTQQTSLF
ncbi:mor transcription activator family protein [Conservatibacter flavescens]|uniref:Mor transcription activator family protein n=1 Tax=Conservatibacter flavescens TaxID=28161 RepID=A0A2M8S521_9PAST|nr:mor transcription activator family protein [Conservatibacter flavescens]PJG86198.1 mor transcription activator family protein [Conservatibacter flavescens]